MRYLLGCLLFCLWLAPVMAEVKTKQVEYRDGDVVLEGYLAWNTDRGSEKSPGVLVIHQWMGLTDYEKLRCRQLAELGYVAFAVDIYGQGVRPQSMAEAGAQAQIYKSNRQLFRQRLNVGLQQMLSEPLVDSGRVAAIGYCFGGTGVLELARSGADFRGGVSFHGGLDSPSPDDGKMVKAKLLICHGADDPFVPETDIKACLKEFNDGGVDWQMISYAHAVHSFTQPTAGTDNAAGAAYNEQADKRSWAAMRTFFDELFAQE